MVSTCPSILCNVSFAHRSHRLRLHQETPFRAPPRPWKPHLGRKSLLPLLWRPSQTPRQEAGAPRVPGRRLASQQAPRPVSREGGRVGNTHEHRQLNGAGLGPAPGCLGGSKPSRVSALWGCPMRPEGHSPGSPRPGRGHSCLVLSRNGFLVPGRSAFSLSRNSSNAKLFTN